MAKRCYTDSSQYQISGSFMGLIDDVSKLPIFRIWSCLKRFDASYL